jgi:drug/metabolite transporter (DMT)-like permease
LRGRDAAELALLAAAWGASFLFMRLGAGEFGPAALAFLRCAGAALCLLPLLLLRARGESALLRRHWRSLLVVGVLNSALPFLAYGYAALAITAGLSSIFNATTPLWGALIAWLWLGERLAPSRVLGLAIGFAGVLGLGWDSASFRPGAAGASSGGAVMACLAATLLYGVSANYTRRRLAGVAPLAVAAGSQLAAALALAPFAAWRWPVGMPSTTAWIAVALLAVVCTGLAYLLYFRLIANVGAPKALAVTFLIPAFALLWGAMFLAEPVTPALLLGCAVILLGTALATGLLGPREPRTA